MKKTLFNFSFSRSDSLSLCRGIDTVFTLFLMYAATPPPLLFLSLRKSSKSSIFSSPDPISGPKTVSVRQIAITLSNWLDSQTKLSTLFLKDLILV